MRYHETEAQFLEAVVTLAKLCGWRVHHIRPARTSKGWTTPVQGDVGFFDLVLARGRTVLFIELKSEKGVWGDEQQEWARVFADAGMQCRLWRPSHWDEIRRKLSEQD